MAFLANKKLKVFGGLLAVAFVGIQFVPVNRENPEKRSEVDAPDEVKAILRRSCYDCHSNETVWPWYSYVAPVSWLIESDVRKGRKHVNFSNWDKAGSDERKEIRHESYEEVDHGEMPMSIYTLIHPDAKLSDKDKSALKDWAEQP